MSSLENLSPREREILRLVAKGFANKEIATQLIPPCAAGTVKGHLKHVFAKLDVCSRAEAAVLWLRLGGEHQAEPTPNVG